MITRQIDFDGNIVKDVCDVKEIMDMNDLLCSLITSEENYKLKKIEVEQNYFEELLNTDWDTINNERKEQGLPKLSNQDMKKAYIMTKMNDQYSNLLDVELEDNMIRRMYDVAMKYSFDILK